MQATQVVQWTSAPSLAISADGRVVAVNAAYGSLVGRPAGSLIGLRCCDVVQATDAQGTRVCRPEDCPTLADLGRGSATQLAWRGWASGDTPLPLAATAIAVPPDQRDDSTAAILVLQVQPPPAEDGSAVCTEPADRSRLDCATDRARVSVRLLGQPECRVDGQRQPLRRRRRAFELLALLAFAGAEGVDRDQAVAMLWPDAPPGNGRLHLRVLLHELRSALGRSAFQPVPDRTGAENGVRLSPDVWVDVLALAEPLYGGHAGRGPERGPRAHLDDLDAAIALYRGELDEAGEFGEWVEPYRERVRGQFLSLLAQAIPLAASCGDVDRALAYCRRAVEVEPLAEAFQVALLTAYGRLGRRHDALYQYRDYSRLLARELSMRPSSTVERAFRQSMGWGGREREPQSA